MALALFGVAARIMVVSSVVSAVIPLTAVGILVVLQALAVCRAFKGLLRTASTIQSHDNRSRNGGLSPEELERLPYFKFRKETKNIKESVLTNCTICLEYFQTGDTCKVLSPCNHGFHKYCVDNWLLMNPICPLCRTPVVVVVVAAAVDPRNTASTAV